MTDLRQPEALRLADALEGVAKYSDSEHWDDLAAAAAELRRLYRENQWIKDDLLDAAKAVLAEREACARVCEQMWHEWLDSPEENEPNKPDAEDCYRAIRARGQA